MDSTPGAVEVLVRLRARERTIILDKLKLMADAPSAVEGESFHLPNEAPFYVVPAGNRVLTLQVDHTVKEIRLLALE